MSLTIKLDTDEACKKENIGCHRLPCKVAFNGYTKVSKYFSPFIRENDSILKCSLRGYPLQGQKIRVPDGYNGVVVRENKHIDSDDKELKATGTFKEFTAWNWDKTPSADDKLVKAMEWTNIAPVLHRPLSENVSKSSKSPQKQRKRRLSE